MSLSDDEKKLIVDLQVRSVKFMRDIRDVYSSIADISENRMRAATCELPRPGIENPALSEWIAQYAVIKGHALLRGYGIPNACLAIADNMAQFICDIMLSDKKKSVEDKKEEIDNFIDAKLNQENVKN